MASLDFGCMLYAVKTHMQSNGRGFASKNERECFVLNVIKMAVMVLLFGLPLVSFATSPFISPAAVKIVQDDSRRVCVEYILSGAPAVITVEFQTNTQENAGGVWVGIGGENVQTLTGEINKLIDVCDKTRSFIWDARKDWPDHVLKKGRIRAMLTAWVTNSLPDYMVVGLEKEKNCDVRYYADAAHVPGGTGDVRYKTEQMLFRKIPAAGVVWKMGPESGEVCNDDEESHLVMLSSDYYMAVYETTQGQFFRATGENPSTSRNEPDADVRPVTNVEYKGLRGMVYTDEENYAYCWPQNKYSVAPGSYIDSFRKKSGLSGMDLPTEAQWEYACRAGVEYKFNVKNWATFRFAHYGKPDNTQPLPVGTLMSNNWGLYDMHGNVAECCLDRYVTGAAWKSTFIADWQSGGVTVDPVGGNTWSVDRIVLKRGGSIVHDEKSARSASRFKGGYNYPSYYIGFRLVCPAVAEKRRD